MNELFYTLGKNIGRIFMGRNFFWHLAMIALTAIIILSGFDWLYYEATRNSVLQIIGFGAAGLGFLVPVFLPIILYTVGTARKNLRLKYAAYASIQAGILGLAISSLYKVFTGRVGLPHIANAIDTSHVFQFGIYRGGAFQGWPSSHTAVAFAMSFALITLFLEKKIFRSILFVYALYIGIGVSMTIHWFSDFVAGAILGTVIGIVVGKSFLQKVHNAI